MKANRALSCPLPGTIGIVTSYLEKKDRTASLTVRQSPDSSIKAECKPEWLEVVAYWKEITPEKIREFLENERHRQKQCP